MRWIKIEDPFVPTLEEMILLSKEVNDWLAMDAQNVIVIHCKGGKGRTETMIYTCLIATGMFLTTKETIDPSGEQRFDMTYRNVFQKIAIPSQHRYVEYFKIVKNVFHGNLPPKRKIKIERIVVHSLYGVGRGDATDLKIDIIMQCKTVFTCTSETCMLLHDLKRNMAIFLLSDCPELCDDIKIKFFSPNLPKWYQRCAFFLCFHTSLVKNNRLYLTRNELDNLQKQRICRFYPTDFAVEIYFEE
ncbi:phosphatidylinositol 3,4,5-trisphosphate 3-phosphatase TPTE2-like isoform X2 [Dipodomys merriami]